MRSKFINKKGFFKKAISLVDEYAGDEKAEKINNNNEQVLVREINKIVKKNKSIPIDTTKLLKNEKTK